MTKLRILGVDPGDTTGYAFIEVEHRGPGFHTYKMLAMGDASFPGGILPLVQIIMKEAHVVAVEDYIIRQPHIGQSPIAIKVIGAIQVVMSALPEKELLMQQPSEKRRAPNTFIKSLHLPPIRSLHIEDAVRHVIIYVQKHMK